MESNLIQMEQTPYREIIRYYSRDWNIEAFQIPRSKIKDKEYKELGIEGHSIYFLYGEDDNDNIQIYVGRSSDTTKSIPVFTRLYQHKVSTSEPYRDNWDSAIAIKFNSLSFDEMRNLENYFYHALLPQLRLNSVEPDTNAYKYDSIKHKVEYIKSFVNSILHEDVFKTEKKQEAIKDVPKLKYREEEIKNEGKRLVDKEFETVTEIQTPLTVIDQMLDLLPNSVWGPDTRFLDLACKSGEYLKAIFNRLLQSPLYKGTPYEDTVSRTLHIISNQLYGVTLTDVSYKLSKQNINDKANVIMLNYTDKGYEIPLCDILSNFNIIESGIVNLQKLHADNNKSAFSKLKKQVAKAKEELLDWGIHENTFEELLKNKLGVNKDMQFDVIIGNPPYQSNSKSIYNDFINTALKLRAKQICMVVKNNWLISDTLKDTRDNMINAGIRKIINYPQIGDVFSNVSAAVTIFHIEQGYKDETSYQEYIKKNNELELKSEYTTNLKGAAVILSNEFEQKLVNKFSKIGNQHYGNCTCPSEPFKVATNGMVGRGPSAYMIDDSPNKTEEYTVKLIYMDSAKQPYFSYIKKDDIPRRSELAPKYKVLCGRIITKDKTVISNIRVVEPNTICSGSWGVLFISDTLEEACNAKKYIRTKFFRSIVRCLSEDGVIALSPYRFSLVPVQNFTNQSDIDWSQSIANIDQQLYRKYSLSPDEVNYIESTTAESIDCEDIIPSKNKYTIQDAAAAYINQKLTNQP